MKGQDKSTLDNYIQRGNASCVDFIRKSLLSAGPRTETLHSRNAKNTSLGNVDFVNKRDKYIVERVENLPNSVEVLMLACFKLADIEARHQNLLTKLAGSDA